jgi:hypothetical protein
MKSQWTFTFIINLPLNFLDFENFKLYFALSLFILQHIIYAACSQNSAHFSTTFLATLDVYASGCRFRNLRIIILSEYTNNIDYKAYTSIRIEEHAEHVQGPIRTSPALCRMC